MEQGNSSMTRGSAQTASSSGTTNQSMHTQVDKQCVDVYVLGWQYGLAGFSARA
jgi:hypothetical protein